MLTPLRVGHLYLYLRVHAGHMQRHRPGTFKRLGSVSLKQNESLPRIHVHNSAHPHSVQITPRLLRGAFKQCHLLRRRKAVRICSMQGNERERYLARHRLCKLQQKVSPRFIPSAHCADGSEGITHLRKQALFLFKLTLCAVVRQTDAPGLFFVLRKTCRTRAQVHQTLIPHMKFSPHERLRAGKKHFQLIDER